MGFYIYTVVNLRAATRQLASRRRIDYDLSTKKTNMVP